MAIQKVREAVELKCTVSWWEINDAQNLRFNFLKIRYYSSKILDAPSAAISWIFV